VDIFDHVTSLVRASRSRVTVSCWRTAGATSLVCHDGYPHAAAAPALRVTTAPSAALLWNQLCLKTIY